MRRPSRPLWGEPDVIITWDRCELLRSAGIFRTLGESRYKLKVHLQGRKMRTYHDALAVASDTLSEPLPLSASSNLHKMVRVSLQTERLTRTVAEAKVPLRSLELLARSEKPYTFSLAGLDDGKPLALAHCRLDMRFNLTPEQEREKQLQEEEERKAAKPPQVGSYSWLCAIFSRCIGRDDPQLTPVRQPSAAKKSQRTVTIHPDFRPPSDL